MEVRIRHGKEKEIQAFARFHRVVCDQPFDAGGKDNGMTPIEMMLSALGCCAMYYAGEYLRARSLSPGGVEMSVSAVKGENPARLVEIEITVDAPGLSGRMREGLIKAIQACPLHRTLSDPPRVKLTMATRAAATVNLAS
jgi:putative redox protein